MKKQFVLQCNWYYMFENYFCIRIFEFLYMYMHLKMHVAQAIIEHFTSNKEIHTVKYALANKISCKFNA